MSEAHVRVVAPTRGEEVPIGSGIWLGRDPEACAVVFPEDCNDISRRHVWIAPHGSGWVARDRSRFGTRRDGVTLDGETTLRDGDVLELPDGIRVAFVAPRKTWKGAAWLVPLALVVTAGVAALLLRPAPPPPPPLAEPTPVPTATPAPVGDGGEVLRTGSLEGAVRELLGALRAEPYDGPIPQSFLLAVRNELVGTVRDEARYCQMRRWRGALDAELRKSAERLEAPWTRVRTYVYLPFVESGYDVCANSYAAAAGMWQFIAGSWNKYMPDDPIRSGHDPRCDWVTATAAAVNHLEQNFADCKAAQPLSPIAGYNTHLRRACSASCPGGDCSAFDFTSYYRRRSDLEIETRDYVPRFVAAWLLGEHPELARREASYMRDGLPPRPTCDEPLPLPPRGTCQQVCR
jgi:hypothetical protein